MNRDLSQVPTSLFDDPEFRGALRHIGRRMSAEFDVKLPDTLETLFYRVWELITSSGDRGPFQAVAGRRKNNEDRELYIRCNEGIKMGLAATYYNLLTFDRLCDDIEASAMQDFGLLPPFTQDFILGTTLPKLLFEYEHFTIHLRLSVDRLAYFLNYFFEQQSGNLMKLQAVLERDYVGRNGSIKQPYAVSVCDAVKRHTAFLQDIHSSDHSRTWTERDTIVHRSFIAFTTVNVRVNPDRTIELILPAFRGDKMLHANARILLRDRFDGLCDLMVDVLSSFFRLSP